MDGSDEWGARRLSYWGRVAMVAALVVAWASVRAIDPRLEGDDDGAPHAFSVRRALAQVRAIAQSPRPLGTPAHAAAREHLVSRLRALGLEADVEEETVVDPLGKGGVLVARVRNVVGRRAGRGAGRLTLASHYDSQPQTPGAGDAASGVATILESLRALGTQWRPVPDLEVVFTDGEELGLMGARAHVASRPPRHPDVLLNFEARGQRGPVAMFETSAGNLDLLRLFAAGVPRPFASSLSYEVYRRMPNDTDFTVFREAGVEGLNFAFISGHAAYHSRLDVPGRLSPATLQQEGVNALALMGALGAGVDVDSGHGGGDAVFFNPWGTSFLLYPASWAWPLCVAIVVATGALWVLLGLRMGMRRRAALAASGLWVASIAAAVVVGWLFERGLRVVPGLLRSPYGEPYDFRAFVAVLALLVGAAVAGLWAARGRAMAASEVLAGSLLFWAVLLVLLTWAVPGASYLAAWPIGFLGLGTVVASLLPGRPVVGVAVLAVAAWAGLAVWAPVCDLVFQALGFGASACSRRPWHLPGASRFPSGPSSAGGVGFPRRFSRSSP
ncbi:MAG: M20/M25/M40 family metallo-hydrolase [Thermoanaerobaculia bacterium]